MPKTQNRTPQILKKYEKELLADWLGELAAGSDGRISDTELRTQAAEFLKLLQNSAQNGNFSDFEGQGWAPVRDFLDEVSRTRVAQGFSSDQTATFILSFKRPLFSRLRKEMAADADALAEETWSATELLDKLGLHTV